MTKRKMLIKGSILRIAEFIMAAIIGLMLMPFIIRSLGDEMYGLWIFVGSFVGYYGLMELGLDSAVKRFLSQSIGAKNYNEANKIVNTAFYLYCIIGLIILIISIATACFIPLLIKTSINVEIFRIVIVILGLNLAIGFPMGVFGTLFIANIRYDISTVISIIKILVGAVLTVVFLKRGFGIITLALITLILSLLTYVIKYYIAKSFYKYINISNKFIDKSRIKQLFQYSIYTFIGQIADQLKFNIDSLVITIFMGLSHVTVYSIGVRFVDYFRKFMAAALGIFMPVFSQYDGQGDYKSMQKLFIFTTKISSYVSVLITSIFIMFGHAFISRWVGMQYLKAYQVLVVLAIAMMFNSMQSPSVQLLYGISKHGYYALVNSIEGIANVILSIVLIKYFGIIGVAIGTAIPLIITKLIIQPIYVCKMINMNLKNYYFSLMFPIITKTVLTAIIYWLIFRKLIIPSYMRLSLLLLGYFILFFIIILLLGFNKSEREILKGTIFRKISD